MTTAARKSKYKAMGKSKPFMLPAIALTKSGDDEVIVPEWIKLFDEGHLTTNDNREWFNTKPDEFIAATSALKLEPPVDVNHNIEHGASDPAMGWVKKLENRSGEIWAYVEWTGRGHTAVANKEYRYVSPSFAYDSRTLEILHLESLALVNKPAFSLPALTSRNPKAAQTAFTSKTETSMFTDEQLAQMRKTYGLADDADADAIMAAMDAANAADEPTAEEKAAAEKAAKELEAKELEAKEAEEAAAASGNDNDFTAESPDPTKWVPRADYDVVAEKQAAAETGDSEATAEADVSSAIETAIASGRIAPSTKVYHTANCATKGGLAAFQKMVKASPEIVPKKAAVATASKDLGATALTSLQKKVCAQTGVSEAAYAKTLATQN